MPVHKEKKIAKNAKKENKDKKQNKGKKDKTDKKQKKRFRVFRGRSPRAITGIIFVMIVIIIVLFLVGIKVQFLTKDELHIHIGDAQRHLQSYHNEAISLSFDVDISNFWFCSSECSFELYDPYAQQSIIQEYVDMGKSGSTTRQYQIDMHVQGQGQRHYYFDARCNNKKSFLCATQELEYLRTALITVDYDLYPREYELREQQQKQLQEYNDAITHSKQNIEQTQSLISNIQQVRQAPKENKTLEENNNIHAQKFDSLSELWHESKFVEIAKIVSDKDVQDTKAIEEMTTAQYDFIKNGARAYNEAMSVLHELLQKQNNIQNAFVFYQKRGKNNEAGEGAYILKKIESNIEALEEGVWEELEEIRDESIKLKERNDVFLQKFNKEKEDWDAEFFSKISKWHTIKNRYQEFTFAQSMNTTSGNSCNVLLILAKEFDNARNAALSNIASLGEVVQTQEFKLISKAYTEYINGTGDIVLYNVSQNTYSINGTIINNTLGILPSIYEQSILLPDISKTEQLSFCAASAIRIKITNQDKNFTEIKIPRQNNNEQSFVISLPQPQCCIFKECSPCENYEPQTPIVFIHGHAFNLKAPVESSLGAFTNIQNKITQEHKIIDAGDIDQSTIQSDYAWTYMSYPIAVRASFYHIIYYDTDLYAFSVRKTESLENYAIRLRELIEVIKEKTKSNKVHIVAHSMGGLVVREYVALFGEESIDKMILVGTPNNGITGKAKLVCAQFGSERECEEMEENSIFLSRLNREEPRDIDMHIIYGTGCDMDGEDGDGVVTAKSAGLPYAKTYEIKGTCSSLLGVELHNDLLKPDKYPQVYDKITEILFDKN